ncbi:OLC1v1035374C1 [Oldenlandia corymbosa var. corymbosa]|uniref:OLC1v1035374C1 n=1 Tax=Oldenlandia corymbosa var. corymbosa TaxID=529605 RepID=A0AAV1CUP3_OLDCO|nr:OLC1v1035374C1 [Oldenlandia corymbosa var. corymbosa]
MVNMALNSNLVALTDGVTGAATAGFVAATTASSGAGAAAGSVAATSAIVDAGTLATTGVAGATLASSVAGASTSGYVAAASASSIASTTTTSFVAAISASSDAGVAIVAVTTGGAADQLQENSVTDLSSTSGGLPSDFDAEFGKFREGPQEQSEHTQQAFVAANEQVLQPLNTISASESLPIIETVVVTEHCVHTDSFCLPKESVIGENYCDNVSPAINISVCLSVDEIKGEREQGQVATPDTNLSVTAESTQCQVASVPKKAAADQQVAVSNDGFQNRRCNSSAELVNDATDSMPVKQKSNHAWLYDKRRSANRRSKRNKGTSIPHGFHFAERVDDGSRLRGIDFNGGDSCYAYFDYGATIEWRIDLAKDCELLKSLIGREKKRSARDQSKMLTPSVMRTSRIKAFGAEVVVSKFSSDSAKINNDVIIQGAADQEKGSVVAGSKGDDKAGDDQACSVTDASKLSTINEVLESISATSRSRVRNHGG